MKLLVIFLLVCPLNLIHAKCFDGFCKLFITSNHNDSLNIDVNYTKVYFYDSKHKTEQMFPINEAATGILSITTLNRTSKFFLYLGGFKSHIEDRKSMKLVKDTFTQIPNSYLIIIDHSAYTFNDYCNNILKDYSRSVKYVHYIGKRVAQMLAELTKRVISPKNIHCMGHSLGGQMLGHVGIQFSKLTNKTIARISALDPAGPCFHDHPEEFQVRSGAADYVEVYHCNAGYLGTKSTLADVDFFLNNGKTQPICKTPLYKRINIKKVHTCSHKQCVDVWAKSAVKKDQFLAFQCENYKMFKDGKCSENHYTIAGFWNPGVARGVYYFSTKGVSFQK